VGVAAVAVASDVGELLNAARAVAGDAVRCEELFKTAIFFSERVFSADDGGEVFFKA